MKKPRPTRNQAADPGGEAGPPVRVLHADGSARDRGRVRNVLATACRRPQVAEASTRDELTSLLESGGFDVCLCDFNVPGCEGGEVLDLIASRAPGAAMVIVTSSRSVPALTAALATGARDYVFKSPLHLALLPQVIESVLERRRSGAEQDPSGEQLARADSRFHRLIENNADGILIVGRDGVVRFANAAAARILARERSALVGGPLGIPITSDAPIEIEVLREDNVKRCAELRVAAAEWDGENSTLVSLRDISERKEIEQRLSASEARYRLALRSASLVAAKVDRQLRYEWIHNPHPDFDAAAAVGLRDDELDSSEEMKRFVAFKQGVLDSGAEGRAEFTFSLSDGVRTYRVIAQPVRESSGEIVGLTTMAMDVSDTRRAAVQIEHLNRVLSAIRNINRLIVQEHDSERLIQRACDLLHESRGLTGTWIALGDGEMTSFAYSGWAQREIAPLREAVAGHGGWPACRARLAAGAPYVIIDEPLVDCPLCPSAAAGGGGRAVAVALRHDGAMLGMLCVAYPPGFEITDDEAALLVEVGEDIAFALKDIEKERHRSQAIAETAALLRANKAVLESPGFGEAARSIFEICRDLVGAADGCVALGGEDVVDAVLLSDDGGFACAGESASGGPIRDLRALAVRERRTVFANQLAAGTHAVVVPNRRAALRNVMFVPITLHGDVKGVFGLANKDGDFGDVDAQRAQAFAETAALALERSLYLQDLKANRDKLEKAQKVARIGHWELDAFDGTPAWSDEIFRIFGLDPGRDAPSFAALDARVHPDDWPQLREAVRVGFAEAAAFDLSFRILRPDREVRWMRAIGEPLLDAFGTVRKLFGTAQDITDLRLAQDSLREREDLLSRITNNMLDMVSLSDLDGRFTYVSPSHRQLGYEPAALLGLHVWEFIHADDKARVLLTLDAAMRALEPRREEFRYRRADGTYAWIETVGQALRDGLGNATGMIFCTRDITARKEIESQLAQSDRLSSMGMLAAGVAHEINNPLSYVLYNLESLSSELPRLLDAVRNLHAQVVDRLGAGPGDGEVRDAAAGLHPAVLNDVLDRIREALSGTHRIRDIARGLGTFSRVEADELAPVNLKYVIETAMAMCFNEIKYRACVVKDYGSVPPVIASEGRLSQVFLNLLVNAAHAIEEGNVESNEIRVRTWSEADVVCAEVRDTGQGIAADDLPRIFEPFFSTKKAGTGSGLGLPISRGIVEGYGGTITVESRIGAGTAFTVRLPVRAVEVAAPAAAAPSEAEMEQRGRLLVVDDEEGIRAAMVRILRGHETVEAGSGEVARDILEKDQAFDVVLCDMMMPRYSGMDLHAWLCEHHPAVAERVIFITGGAFTPRTREYLARVKNLRIEKPFDIVNFRKIVADKIRLARRRTD